MGGDQAPQRCWVGDRAVLDLVAGEARRLEQALLRDHVA
jgi:hypothetical protein